MKKLIYLLVSALTTGIVLAQSTGVNGGGPNGGGGGGASPGGATNAVQYNAGGGNLGGVSLTADQALMGAAGTPLATALINCGDATHALAYSTSTHTYSCQALSGGGGGTPVFKTGTTSRSNTTTVSLDPDLQVVGQAAGNHTMTCFLSVTTAGASSGGFRVQPTTTATISGGAGSFWYNVIKSDNTATPTPVTPMQSMAAAVSDAAEPANNGNSIWIVNASYVTSTSGTAGLSWAQAASTGQNTQLIPGSYCNFT